jgi:hypothetical protein
VTGGVRDFAFPCGLHLPRPRRTRRVRGDREKIAALKECAAGEGQRSPRAVSLMA